MIYTGWRRVLILLGSLMVTASPLASDNLDEMDCFNQKLSLLSANCKQQELDVFPTLVGTGQWNPPPKFNC
jgi:hypothetical protein